MKKTHAKYYDWMLKRFSICMLLTVGGLPCGFWRINANGLIGGLNITSVNNDGKVNGTIFDRQINGSWDEISKKITFMEPIRKDNVTVFYKYEGFLHDYCTAIPIPVASAIFNTGGRCDLLSGSTVVQTGKEERTGSTQEFPWLAILEFGG